MMVVMAVMVVAERRGEHENKAFSILNVIVPGTAVHIHTCMYVHTHVVYFN